MIRQRLLVAGVCLVVASSSVWSEDCGVFGEQSSCNYIISQDDRIISYQLNPDGTISWDYVWGSGGGAGGTFSGSQTDFSNWAHDWVGGDTNSLSPAPEPETYAMLVAGLGLLALVRSRKKEKPGD